MITDLLGSFTRKYVINLRTGCWEWIAGFNGCTKGRRRVRSCKSAMRDNAGRFSKDGAA